MAEITAASVKELRERTGAGMMDCKKALAENQGDMEASVDWLRAKGLAAAAKKAGRSVNKELLAIVEKELARATPEELDAELDRLRRTIRLSPDAPKPEDLIREARDSR